MTFPRKLVAVAAGVVCLAATACQQKMATQPAPRPYEQNNLFANKQSVRPLEKGVVHRNQRLDDDPLVSWLTPEGKKASDVKPDAQAAWNKDSVVPQAGAPVQQGYFVAELPFAPSGADLRRGQTLFNSNCALCHGAAGWGNGKIAERGFLRPPSYHVDPAGKEGDWSTWEQPSKMNNDTVALPMGYSRGFYRWGAKVALKDVPVGYIYQVITWGYGGMGSHDTQIPDPADRWRVTAYVRTLQLAQAGVPAGSLPKEAVEAAGKTPVNGATVHGNGEGHK